MRSTAATAPSTPTSRPCARSCVRSRRTRIRSAPTAAWVTRSSHDAGTPAAGPFARGGARRPSMKIGLRIFLGYFLIVALAALLLMRVFVAEVKPGVRQAMEDTLVDTANVLAELATPDFLAGRINDGEFARRVRALHGRNVDARIWGLRKHGTSYRIYVTDARGIVVFDSVGRDLGKDYSRWNDVYLTLRGRYGARSTATDPNDDASSVMHVAAPLHDAQGRIIGVLTVAKPNRAIAPV